MRKLIVVLGAFFLITMSARAQTGAPAFSVTTQAMVWRGAGQSYAGTDAIGIYQVSPNWAVRSDNFVVPNEGLMINTFGLQYGRNLADFFKNPATKATASRWKLYANAGIGAISAPSPAHVAGNAGAMLNYDIDNSGKFAFNVAQVEAMVGQYSLGTTPGVPSSNFSFEASTGIKVSF